MLSFTLLHAVTVGMLSYGVAAIACPEPLPPANGMITAHGIIQDGTVLTATCTNGGMMTGASSLTCTNGMWQPPAFGICSATPNSQPGIPNAGGLGAGGLNIQCPAMIAPLGATVTYSDDQGVNMGLPNMHSQGSVATMRCNDNSMVTGSTTSTCLNGMWNPPTLGTCSGNGLGVGAGMAPQPGLVGLPTTNPCLLGLLPPLNGRITYSSTVPPYPHGSTATLTCEAGFMPRGATTATCNNGIFGLLGTCERSI